MRRLACAALSVLVLGLGCAEGTSIGEASAGAGTTGAGGAPTGAGGTGTPSSTGAGGAGGGLAAQSCPPDQFATGVENGQLVCAGIDPLVIDAVNSGCAVYFGWNDSCGACTTPPAKWGHVGASACTNGLGVNGTCTTATLGAQSVQLFGLNTGGDVNDDDKFHLGFRCDEGSSEATPGPCAPGELVSGLSGQDVTCTPASGAILAYVRERCSLYFGWRDSCDGCTTAPTKWGSVTTTACSAGTGAGNTCTTPMLGGEAVQLFGLSTGGNVNDDDKLYVGLRCDPPMPEEGTAPFACPPGQLVTGVEDDGTIACASPAPLVASYFADRCTSAPSKWGAVSQNVCTNDLGAGSTCQTAMLGGATVELFGLNTDGDVDDDDKFYFGFRCD
jgi:hypothetical protein